MKLKILSISAIVSLCFVITSCKKDAPVYPGDPDFVPYQGTSGGSSTIVVDVNMLTGSWEVTATYEEVYNASGTTVSSNLSPFNLFSGVELNNTGNNFLFSGSLDTPGPGTYTTSTAAAGTSLQLSADPFGRSANTPVQIKSLTATSMTWVAIDPMETNSPAGILRSGFKVVYARKM